MYTCGGVRVGHMINGRVQLIMHDQGAESVQLDLN
jgi:hypothetical protein